MSQAQVEDRNSNSGSESRTRSIVSQPTDEGSEYENRDIRLDTFGSYPSPSPVNIIQLANAGFYYQPDDNTKFRVVCVGCSVIVNTWNTGDVPSDQRFHASGCRFTRDASGSHGGRSGGSRGSRDRAKATVLPVVEESTKPHVINRNFPHASMPGFPSQQRMETLTTSVQPGYHGASMPANVKMIHTQMQAYHNPATGQSSQTIERIETTSGHGRGDDRDDESPMQELYAPSNEPRSAIPGAQAPAISLSYQPEDEVFQTYPSTREPSYTSQLQNSQSLQTFLTGLNMKVGENRLHTFQELWDENLPFRNTRLLVMCGFYCIGQGDAVKCFHCGVVIANWSRNDNPRLRHGELSPHCQFHIEGEGSCGDQPLSVLTRRAQVTTPRRSLSSSSYGQFGHSSMETTSFRSFPPQPEYSRDVSVSSRNELYPPQPSIPYAFPMSVPHGRRQHSPQSVSSSYRGQTHLYQGEQPLSRHSPAHSPQHSRSTSFSPQRGGIHVLQPRSSRSPFRQNVAIQPSPAVSPHHSRPSSRSPSHHSRYHGYTSVEEPMSQPIPEEYQPPQPPPPRSHVSRTSQRNDRTAHYRCLDPAYPRMRDVGTREATFRPPFLRISRLNVTFRGMAEAGFFYKGEWDRVCCWYCGGGLEKFSPGDEIWTEHAKYYPNCEYLLQRRGPEFVQNILNRHPVDRPVPVEQLPTVESNSGPLPPPPPRMSPEQLDNHRANLLEEGMYSAATETARDQGFSEDLIRQVHWTNILARGACYQTSEAMVNALLDATDARDGPRVYADQRRRNPLHSDTTQSGQTFQTQSAPSTRSAHSGTHNNQRQPSGCSRQHSQMTDDGIYINGLPMSEHMASVFDTPFFRGELNQLFDDPTNTAVNLTAPNVTVRTSYVVNNTRRPTQPQTAAPSRARSPNTPAAVSTVPPPTPPPLTAMEIPSRQRAVSNSENEGTSTSQGSVTRTAQQRLEMLEREKRCKICLSNESDILYQPCGHICSCSECADRTEVCPVCRAAIARKIRTYRS